MLDHSGFVVTALAKALGFATIDNSEAFFLLGRRVEEPLPTFWIGTLRPSYRADGSRAGLNRKPIAFTALSKDAVRAFHAAGLGAGGRDNGPPGPREGAANYYRAFPLDPDGNVIEACFREMPHRA